MAVFVLEHEGVPPGQQLRVGRALQASAVEQQHNKREKLKEKKSCGRSSKTREAQDLVQNKLKLKLKL